MRKKNYPSKSNRKKTDRRYNTATSAMPTNLAESITIPPVITVKELSEKTGIPVVNLISELMKSGILAAINESIDFETAAIVCDDLGIKCEIEGDETSSEDKTQVLEKSDKDLTERPPVVTIMGHVDHGKTSLLDKIRLADVASSESGGITQHISAYQVEIKSPKKDIKNRIITFIDTPGHAAFSALRGHGASITDMVILIVAADDGIMPQTVEVIEQCQKHHVPIIVAINKVDLPDADIMKVKQQLSEYNLLTEEWGGKTVMVEVSAKTGQGIEDLLEVIALQADMMELKADNTEKAFGVVIESHMHKGAGPMALVLIENGTLHRGDAIQIGTTYGRVRILEDHNSKSLEQAGPSTPVMVAGLKDMPSFGEHLIVFDSEKEAKEAAEKSIRRANVKIATAKKLSEETQQSSDRDLDFKIILKADVKGSLEAAKKLLSEIDTKELSIKIIGEGIGAVSESDVTLAKATGSFVFAFRVPVLVSAKKISEKDKVKILSYEVIYEMINDIKEMLSAKLVPELVEESLGRGEVIAIFRNDKKAFVAGASLEEGKISVGDNIRFVRDGEVASVSKVISLRREKDQVSEVAAGVEFGFSLDPNIDVIAKDKIEVFKINEVIRKIL